MIGERIKELRKALNLTQDAFSESISIGKSHVSLLESGKREPSELLLKSILSAFPQVSEKWLRSGEGEMFEETTDDYIDEFIRRHHLPDVTRDVLLTYVSLPDEAQQAVCDFARRLVDRIRSSQEDNQKEKLPRSRTEEEHKELLGSIERELLAKNGQADQSSASRKLGTDEG